MGDPRYARRHGFLGRVLDRLLVAGFRCVNQTTSWHRLPKWLALANLHALRVELREQNLVDTEGDLTTPKPECPFHPGPGATRHRTVNGTQNDLAHPAMGCRYSRFGRNMVSTRPRDARPDLLHPNPLLLSRRLMKREQFQPATSLNLLAAAWIQFQVHDWFAHETEPPDAGKDLRVPQAGDWPAPEMVVPQTRPDPSADPQGAPYPVYRNKNPQWWGGSQIYGETTAETLRLRTDPTTGQLCPRGKLYLDGKGLLPVDPDTGQTVRGFTDNWWVGLELLHTLFAREQNAICEAVSAAEPHRTNQELFEIARLVNCAVMAKIHTVEWTPGILAHPAIQPGLDSNWMGLVGHFWGEGLARVLARALPEGFLKDLLTGSPLTEPDHHGAPFSLTEEFTAVYRLHPLIPDEVVVREFHSGVPRRVYPMAEVAFHQARRPLEDGAGQEDLLYSFGVAHPGAITIRNYPNFLRALQLPPDPTTGHAAVLDLAAVDLLRDRERGVPRYNEFRRRLRLEPAADWLTMAGGRADLAQELKELYEGNLEDVDTMVGMFCEPLPEGFGFSDTAFRIFILMASRRLKSDRFFTSDFTEEFYTATGLEWIEQTGMKEVILRHHPTLAGAFAEGQNPFAPWRS